MNELEHKKMGKSGLELITKFIKIKQCNKNKK